MVFIIQYLRLIRSNQYIQQNKEQQMEIIEHPNAVEIKDGSSFEITFWDVGDYSEIVISGIGYDDVVFGGIPGELMLKIQNAILEYKEEKSND